MFEYLKIVEGISKLQVKRSQRYGDDSCFFSLVSLGLLVFETWFVFNNSDKFFSDRPIASDHSTEIYDISDLQMTLFDSSSH